MSKTPKNKIVVRVIEDEALILDLMEEVLADLDVPQKKGVVDLGTFIGTPLSISIWSIGNGAGVLRCDRPMGTDEPSS